MVYLKDSHSHSNSNNATHSHLTPLCYYTPPPSTTKSFRSVGRSMRTIRSNVFQSEKSQPVSENLTDSVVDMRLGELANKSHIHSKPSTSSDAVDDFLEISQTFSDYSACSSDVSGELQLLASLPSLVDSDLNQGSKSEPEPEPCAGFLQRETFSTEIVEIISPEDLQPTVKICVDGLKSASIAVKRSAAAKLRQLAKNRVDNRAMIGESGAVPALISLLRSSDPWTQENAVTALLNISLHESNKSLIASSGAIKSVIYVLKTGTETSKQNAACALLSLALIDENKSSIGACGAIPPLVALLINGSNRGKKDALTTLYKLCSVRVNKGRAVSAGAVGPLVGLVGEQGTGLAEKAMVVLSSLAGIEMGREAIMEEGGIVALVEALEDGSDKGKEFAVLTLLQLCGESVKNRELLVGEGGIPPLVALSQTGTAKAMHKAEMLLMYLRESRQEASTP
ncbi:unnamed protein product [Fraxinus pennsylvanica]|uniref:U-box domain-containing protein n=1 Tax=Fraxinus pennsylvanica TaxID=56036 RepID=A0AAD1YRS5_9LAMI|nr:unnamed protein product [Fraxinus pennsylvanica]